MRNKTNWPIQDEKEKGEVQRGPTSPPRLRMLSEICSLTGWCKERERERGKGGRKGGWGVRVECGVRGRLIKVEGESEGWKMTEV